MRKGLLWMGLLVLGLLPGCRGGVVHPEPGEPNSERYCADRNDSENNCSACSSQPGCGWCDVPQQGRAQCQPGTTTERPGTCREGWALSTEDCPAPPPPAPAPPLSTSPPSGPAMTIEGQLAVSGGEPSGQ